LTQLASQIQSFTLTLVLGLITGVIFHYYQLFIRQARVGRFLLYVMDLILWVMIIALVFWAMICINQGEVRLYVLTALLIGILLYFRILSGRFDRVMTGIAARNVQVLTLVGRQLKRGGANLKAMFLKLAPRSKVPPPDPE